MSEIGGSAAGPNGFLRSMGSQSLNEDHRGPYGLRLRARRDRGPGAVDGGRPPVCGSRFPSSRTWTIRGRTSIATGAARSSWITWISWGHTSHPPRRWKATGEFSFAATIRVNTTRSARDKWWRTSRAGPIAGRRPQELAPLLKLAALAQKTRRYARRRSAHQPASDSDVAEFPVPHRTRSGGPWRRVSPERP